MGAGSDASGWAWGCGRLAAASSFPSTSSGKDIVGRSLRLWLLLHGHWPHTQQNWAPHRQLMWLQPSDLSTSAKQRGQAWVFPAAHLAKSSPPAPPIMRRIRKMPASRRRSSRDSHCSDDASVRKDESGRHAVQSPFGHLTSCRPSSRHVAIQDPRHVRQTGCLALISSPLAVHGSVNGRQCSKQTPQGWACSGWTTQRGHRILPEGVSSLRHVGSLQCEQESLIQPPGRRGVCSRRYASLVLMCSDGQETGVACPQCVRMDTGLAAPSLALPTIWRGGRSRGLIVPVCFDHIVEEREICHRCS